MEEKILEILQDIKPNAVFEGKTDIVTGQTLKSLDLMMLISELEDEFDVEIPVENVVPANFDSIESIAEMIRSFQ